MAKKKAKKKAKNRRVEAPKTFVFTYIKYINIYIYICHRYVFFYLFGLGPSLSARSRIMSKLWRTKNEQSRGGKRERGTA